MRFTDYLNKDALERVKKDCKKFLHMTDMPLYRGVSSSFIKPFMRAKVAQVRKDRKPRDSTPYAHKLMDDWFNEHFHIRPRSQGVFCTGKLGHTRQYGKAAYVFPVGDFKFIWGIDAHDAHDRHPVFDTLSLSRRLSEKMMLRSEKDSPQVTDEIMSSVEWRMDDIEEAQQTGAEIVLMCDEIVLVPVTSYPKYIDLLEKLR